MAAAGGERHAAARPLVPPRRKGGRRGRVHRAGPPCTRYAAPERAKFSNLGLVPVPITWPAEDRRASAGPNDHISGLNAFRLCLDGFFFSFIRALLVPGPAAGPQAGRGASAGWRAPPRAGPPRAGRHLLRAAGGLPVEGAGCDRPRLGLDGPPPLPGVGRGRAVLPALAGGGAALRRGGRVRLALARRRRLL